MIVMDAKTQLKLDVVTKVYLRKISVKNATKLLRKSTRTIERYLAVIVKLPYPQNQGPTRTVP